MAAATLMMAATPLLIRATQSSEGRFEYSVPVLVASVEQAKLGISLFAYAMLPCGKHSHRTLTTKEMLLYAAPGMLFCANNQLQFSILSRLNSSTFQVLSNAKIAMTALLLRLVLHRLLSASHYLSLVSLTAGAAFVQIGCEPLAPAGIEGALFTLVSCALSSLGNVLNEAMLKKEQQIHSIWLANSLLYTWSSIFSAIAAVWDLSFRGFTPLVGALVVAQVVAGLSVSFVLRFSSNIGRSYAHVCATLLCLGVESAARGEPLDLRVLVATVVVGSSAAQYALLPPPARPATSAQLIE